MDLVDRWGLCDNEATRVLDFWYGESLENGKEYGSYVNRDPRSGVHYTGAPVGEGTEIRMENLPPLIDFPDAVAYWHTHGREKPGFDGEKFSDRDYQTLKMLHNLPNSKIDMMYVVTPSGKVLRGHVDDWPQKGTPIGRVPSAETNRMGRNITR